MTEQLEIMGKHYVELAKALLLCPPLKGIHKVGRWKFKPTLKPPDFSA
jgi:hypothetical protein